MLVSLHIRDYALIEELDVEFTNGLNIITGETGAGKSILIGALKLILGERAQTDTVRTGAGKAVVEGTFEASDIPAVGRLLREGGFDEDGKLILRREISDGKSRTFINDSPASVQQLRAVGDELVDLHGQHEHQSLLRPEVHLRLVDSFGGLEGLYRSYREQYKRVSDLIRMRQELLQRESELARQREEYAFQIEEIDEIDPVDGEDDDLDAERRILENAEKLFASTASLYDVLYESEDSVQDQLVRVRNELLNLNRIDDRFDELQREITAAQVSVSEVAKVLQDYNSQIEFNPKRLDQIRERLIALDRLKRRYGGAIATVLEHRQEIGEKHALAVDMAGTLKRLDTEIEEAMASLSEIALRQSTKRREVAGRIEAAIVKELAALGMSHAQFEIVFERTSDPEGWILDPSSPSNQRFEALAAGVDRATFHISTNPGEAIRPLARVASGGEVSRIMLALKSILAKSDRLPILIFDEIDAGISGSMARLVGERLHRLARYHQIIAITHLPQVAALSDAHFRVQKSLEEGRTVTSIRPLDERERQQEVASLISGARVTQAALDSAKELIDLRPEITHD